MIQVCIHNLQSEAWDISEQRFRSDVLNTVPNDVVVLDSEYWIAKAVDDTTNIVWFESTEMSIERAIESSVIMQKWSKNE